MCNGNGKNIEDTRSKILRKNRHGFLAVALCYYALVGRKTFRKLWEYQHTMKDELLRVFRVLFRINPASSIPYLWAIYKSHKLQTFEPNVTGDLDDQWNLPSISVSILWCSTRRHHLGRAYGLVKLNCGAIRKEVYDFLFYYSCPLFFGSWPRLQKTKSGMTLRWKS